MKKNTLIFFVFLILKISVFAQNSNVKGSVADTFQNKGIKHTVLLLLTPKDSVLYKFTRADGNGNFVFSNIKPGNYILMTTHPYYADVVENIEVGNTEKLLGKIALTSKSKLLQEVIVKSGSPIKIKGDTTVYTADSFKVSANANVEELLKKLPGIQVDRDGKIKAMGETVEKVLVDGEEFFGDDPGMAVKNLRADAVKEVQVFDKKSDQSTFTGIDDGKTQKTINLKLKEDKKRGYFGKLDIAGGLLDNIDDRYNSNAMIGSFKGKRKLAAFLLTGNTGQDGLSWQDNDKFGGDNDNMTMSMDEDGGMMYMWRGGGSDDEPYVNTQNGFIRNINAGASYNNKFGDNKTLSFSPKYNNQIYNNGLTMLSQTQIGDSSLNEDVQRTTSVNRSNIKTSASYDIKIDSVNSLKITVKANFYDTRSEELSDNTTVNQKSALLNTSNVLNRVHNEKQALTSSILFKHKFKKARRTISLNADWNYLNTDGDNFLQSGNVIYSNGFPVISQDIDQQRLAEKSTNKISSRIVYTEPLSKKYSMELGYEISFSKGINNQKTFSYSNLSGKYDEAVDSLTNNFDQTIVINKPNFRINYGGKKVKFNFGSGFGLTHFDLKDKTLNKDYVRNFTNFFPNATFNYTYKANHSLRFTYNGNTSQPTINQLQPLTNNAAFFNQYIGNPDLKPSFTHSFNTSHNSYNFIKDMWMYQSLNVRVTNNSITNSREIDGSTGKTITQPINTNGNVSINFWSGMGMKLKKIDLRVNIQPNFNYSKFADIINGQTNFSKTSTTGLGLYASKSKDKKYDISIGNDFSFNRNTTTQNSLVNKFYTNNINFNATVYYKKVWSVNTSYEYFTRQKTVQIPNAINNQLWNARIQKTFKDNEFTAYVLVRDILNQNIGIDRNFSGNTFSETRNDRLRRYWMIGFTWDFKNKAPKNN